MSVVMGEFLTRWYMAQHGYDNRFFVRTMPGEAWGAMPEMWTWWSVATAKMVLGQFHVDFPCKAARVDANHHVDSAGILAIFAWRIFAKFLLHRILPPTFRFLAQLFTLPHRRFYIPATDYTNVPPAKGMHPIPSVLDLPGMLNLDADSVSTARKNAAAASWNQQIKLRGAGRANVKAGSEKLVLPVDSGKQGMDSEMGGTKAADVVKHYDADGKYSRKCSSFNADINPVLRSFDKGLRILWHRHASHWLDASCLRAHWLGSLRTSTLFPFRHSIRTVLRLLRYDIPYVA